MACRPAPWGPISAARSGTAAVDRAIESPLVVTVAADHSPHTPHRPPQRTDRPTQCRAACLHHTPRRPAAAVDLPAVSR